MGCGATQKWTWVKPDAHGRISPTMYQDYSACLALHAVCASDCCTTHECHSANQALYERCNYDRVLSGPSDLISLTPDPFQKLTLESIPLARLSSFKVVPTIKTLAGMVDLNYLIDSTNEIFIESSAYDVQWSAIFFGIVRASGLKISPVCHALVIGDPKIMLANPLSMVDEIEGKRIKFRDCESNNVYSGRRHIFSFDNNPIQDAFAQISVLSNLSIVLGAHVNGSVTGNLRDVAWDEALDIISIMFGLDKVQTGNLIRIDRSEILKSEREDLKESICTCCGADEVHGGISKNKRAKKISS